jgi:hypothetical protein
MGCTGVGGLTTWQRLCKDVRELRGRRHMQDVDITNGYAFPDEVEVDLDMLCTLVLNGVGGEVDGANIIAVDGSVFLTTVLLARPWRYVLYDMTCKSINDKRQE